MNDTISREAAINALFEMYCKSDEDGYVWIIRSDACLKIDALPSTQPKRKRGKWIIDEKRFGNVEHHCNLCGAILEGDEWKWRNNYFCYHCGADMRGEQDGRDS